MPDIWTTIAAERGALADDLAESDARAMGHTVAMRRVDGPRHRRAHVGDGLTEPGHLLRQHG